MAYNAAHIADGSDWHGASLKALELLGRKLGYQLAGTNFNGVNAFFVREDLAADKFITPATAENLYNPLRMQIKFVSSHSARYCLVNQQENLGLKNYYDDGKARSYEPRGIIKSYIRRLIYRIGYAWRNG